MRELPERELGPEPEPGRMEGLGLALELPLEAVGKKHPPEEKMKLYNMQVFSILST